MKPPDCSEREPKPVSHLIPGRGYFYVILLSLRSLCAERDYKKADKLWNCGLGAASGFTGIHVVRLLRVAVVLTQAALIVDRLLASESLDQWTQVCLCSLSGNRLQILLPSWCSKAFQYWLTREAGEAY